MSELEDLKDKNLPDFRGIRVAFQQKKTDSDIEIVGGSTTIEKKGTALGVSTVAGPQGQPMFLVVIAGDDKGWYVINLEACKIL